MDIVLVCDMDDFNIYWLREVHKIINKNVQMKLTIDYRHSRLMIQIIDNIKPFMYVKKCAITDLISVIKKLNS